MRFEPARWLLLMSVLMASLALSGCAEDSPTAADAAPRAARLLEGVAAEPRASQQDMAAVWLRSCALCHVDGTGGAPRAGIAEDWAARLPQGEAMLLLHTVEGYRNMPPLGYCMDCTRSDFLALIGMMTPVEAP